MYRVESEAIRSSILKNNKRPDGRGAKDIRPLHCEVGLLPRTHGSAVFARGETQAFVMTTLGSKSDVQDMDAWTGGPTEKRFILHYNFPPFSVGETGRTGGPGRREIGHGALAERSIEPMIPAELDFPYTIRVHVGNHGVQRLDFDGHGVRRDVVVAGRRRAVEGAGGRDFHRLDHRRQDGPGADDHGHHRRRRPFRRHGFQSGRHSAKASRDSRRT